MNKTLDDILSNWKLSALVGGAFGFFSGVLTIFPAGAQYNFTPLQLLAFFGFYIALCAFVGWQLYLLRDWIDRWGGKGFLLATIVGLNVAGSITFQLSHILGIWPYPEVTYLHVLVVCTALPIAVVVGAFLVLVYISLDIVDPIDFWIERWQQRKERQRSERVSDESSAP